MRKFLILFILLYLLTGNLISQDRYFSLGGHLFAGDYPINNPVSTGDTGMIFLYRVSNKNIIPVDTMKFSNLGYFVFLSVKEGEYLMKAGLTKNSTHYLNFFPSYYASSLRWNSSGWVRLNDSSIYEANIRLIPTAMTNFGTSSIKGYVVQSADEDGMIKLQDTEVILFNENLDPIAFCLSDKNGSFSFYNLPLGTYHLLVEYTGMFSVLEKIILDKDHSDYDNLVLEVRSHQPAGLEQAIELPGTAIGRLFPNPAGECVRTVIKTTEPQNFEAEVYTVTGVKVLSCNYYVQGIRSVEIPVEALVHGTYFLVIRSSGSHFMKVQKFVKL